MRDRGKRKGYWGLKRIEGHEKTYIYIYLCMYAYIYDGGVHLRYIVSTYVNIAVFPIIQLLYANKIFKMK
jgi:hypothetical protein